MRIRRLLVIFCIGLLLLLIFNWKKSFNSDIGLCPACYGEDFCDFIIKEHHEIQSQSSWKLFRWILNVKNVYFISVKNENHVMKKLAHDRELAQFDETLCKRSDKSNTCDISRSWKKVLDRHDDNISLVIQENSDLFTESEVIKCGHSAVLQHLVSKHVLYDKSSDAISHFLTVLSINPEPLILKVCLLMMFTGFAMIIIENLYFM